MTSKEVTNAMAQSESAFREFRKMLAPHIEEIAAKHNVKINWVGDAALPEGNPDDIGRYVEELNMFLWEST